MFTVSGPDVAVDPTPAALAPATKGNASAQGCDTIGAVVIHLGGFPTLIVQGGNHLDRKRGLIARTCPRKKNQRGVRPSEEVELTMSEGQVPGAS